MTDDTDTGDMPDLTELYRNDPTATFDAHLFGAGDVEKAGGADGEKADRPVASICSRTTAYGEFHRVAEFSDADERVLDLPGVDPDETVAEAFDLCDVCAERLNALHRERSIGRATYEELREVAAGTTDVPGSGLTLERLRERLREELGDEELNSRLLRVRA